MKTSRILLIAFFCYAVLMAAGGAAYYVVSTMQAEHPTQTKEASSARQQEMEAESKRQAQESAKEVADRQARTEKEHRIDVLKSHMEQRERNGMRIYTFGYSDTPPPGVYLRPFVVETSAGDVILKHDVFYYYTIEDPVGTNWIFGDHLDVTADGVTETEAFDPKKLRKFMAVNAESLSENYVVNADKKIVEMLRRVGNAKSASIRYYKDGEKERRHTLTTDERERVREVVELYDLLKEDADMGEAQ